MEEPTSSVDNFARFLKWWWCRTYNRPMKDPLLATYTLNELCYEFLRHYYLNPDNDPKKELEAKEIQADEDKWIKDMMSKIPPSEPTKPAIIEPKSDPLKSELDDLANLPDISTSFSDDPET